MPLRDCKLKQKSTATYILEWPNPNADMDVEQEKTSFIGNYGGHFGNFLQN